MDTVGKLQGCHRKKIAIHIFPLKTWISSMFPNLFFFLVDSQKRLFFFYKAENSHVFYLTPISNFHGFSIEITENHVFSTLVIKLLVFPRFVEKSTLVATLYMIVLSEYEGQQTTLSVSDLSAIKNPKTEPDRLLLGTFNVDIAADGLIVDETHILVVSRKNQVVVIDFGSFDRYECRKSLLV